jgi:hypothetical protein
MQIKVLKLVSLYMYDWNGYNLKFAWKFSKVNI